MKRASITEAKNNLSALLDRVRHGAAILIEDRGIPVARLEPVTASGRGASAGRAARLIRQGVVRPAAEKQPRRVLAADPPVPSGTASLTAALLDERRSGR